MFMQRKRFKHHSKQLRCRNIVTHFGNCPKKLKHILLKDDMYCLTGNRFPVIHQDPSLKKIPFNSYLKEFTQLHLYRNSGRLRRGLASWENTSSHRRTFFSTASPMQMKSLFLNDDEQINGSVLNRRG